MNSSIKILRIDLRLQKPRIGVRNDCFASYSVRTIKDVSKINNEIKSIQPKGLYFDCDFPNITDLKLLRKVIGDNPNLPTLFVTEWHSESLAVWAFRTGVWDYLVRPLHKDDLQIRLEQIVKGKGDRRENKTIDDWSFSHPIPKEFRFNYTVSNKKTSLAISHIHEHFYEKILVDKVARLCGLSISQFSRYFKTEHKLTFQEYLLQYRIKKSKLFLVNPKACVLDIAIATGFNDASYFTRTFRRLVGMSPSDYRQQNNTRNYYSDLNNVE